MDTQLTTPQWIFIIAVWLISGMLVDIFKIILSTLKESSAETSVTLKNMSRNGRIKINQADFSNIQLKIVKDIAKVLGQIKCSLISWSVNFIRQVVEPDNNYETKVTDPITSTKATDTKDESYLVPCENNIESIFSSQPENKHAGQQIIGALLGFTALLAFLYADAAQGAQTFTLLFDGSVIPPFLNDIIIPLVTASAGSALILGIFIGDILGMTHLGLFSQNTSKRFLWLIIINLILSLALSTFIALTRMQLLGTNSSVIQTIVNIAQSVVILPMLITTFLLFRGVAGIYVVLSLLLWAISVSFGIFEFSIRILGDLLRSGIIGGTFIITKIIWLVVGTLELLFVLIELAINGGFSVLIHLISGVFLIPNFIFRIILNITKQDEFYHKFLSQLIKPTENKV